MPRTSVHHHLSQLRNAGFLALVRRPDRTYQYEARPEVLERAAADLASFVFPHRDGTAA